MRKYAFLFVVLLSFLSAAAIAAMTGGQTIDSGDQILASQTARISIRIERFPRPPYSGATYYIYERRGETICTKLEVCNKYDDCFTEYKKGAYKDELDVETGDPYGTTKPVVIASSKLRKHVCLTKFKLIK